MIKTQTDNGVIAKIREARHEVSRARARSPQGSSLLYGNAEAVQEQADRKLCHVHRAPDSGWGQDQLERRSVSIYVQVRLSGPRRGHAEKREPLLPISSSLHRRVFTAE
jgi:hypothetical protein